MRINLSELYHHGILGQKWGVRRYQNPDGSLTAAGQKRYAKAEEKRTALAGQAERVAKSMKEMAKDAKETYKTLEKEGPTGATMKNWIGDISDSDFMNDYGMSRVEYFNEELNSWKANHKRYIDAGEKWTKYMDSLLEMDISGLSRQDVAKRAKQLQRNAFNS